MVVTYGRFTFRYFKALVAIVKLCIGTGMLSLPNAFYNAGLTVCAFNFLDSHPQIYFEPVFQTGIVLSFLIAFTNVHCMHILVTSNQILCQRLEQINKQYEQVLDIIQF